MSKPAKPAAKEEAVADAAPKKNKKKLFILIAVAVLLLGGGGTAAFLLMKKPAKHAPANTADATEEDNADAEEEASVKEDEKHPPKFVDLGAFTTNLANEDGEHVVQVVVSVKIKKPELEEKIKGRTPEIAHYINMVLQSKRPSDISNLAGKQKLAEQIKAQIEYVLGFRKKAPPIIAESNEPTDQQNAKGSEKHSAKPEKKIKSDVAEVLFTSFIVQ